MMRDARWSRYANTILELGAQHSPVIIDLRTPLDASSLNALDALPLAVPFGVVTAANPIGHYLSAEENRSRLEILRTRLALSPFPYVEAGGVSPDRSHREAGFAVHAPREEICRLAKEFEQAAFFWFDGSSFWLVDAFYDTSTCRLPLLEG